MYPNFKDLLMANREGVVSSVGYLALYLSGVSWGQNLIEKSKSVKDKVKQFAILGNIFMVLLYLFPTFTLCFNTRTYRSITSLKES